MYCCTIAKKFAIMGLPFFDAHVFKPWNAKKALDMALAFFNANALRALVFEMLKRFYFIILKLILSILLSYFTTPLTSQFLFLYTIH